MESWRIDYIRVETEGTEETEELEETEGTADTPLTRTSRPTRSKAKTKKVRKAENVAVKTTATTGSLKAEMATPPPENLKMSMKSRQTKSSDVPAKISPPPADWSQMFRSTRPSQHAVLTQELLCRRPGTPKVPNLARYASRELVDHLAKELEPEPCPAGCGDSFILPHTFFQHVYR